MPTRREMEKLVLQELIGRLWHTTQPDRYSEILSTGAILAQPDIPNSERWKASSFVRSLGGVSLFDFAQFDTDRYSDLYPAVSWHSFVPYPTTPRCAVWIEINREKVFSKLICPFVLLARWKSEKASTAIMADIEAAHLGPVPRTAFKRAFRVNEGEATFQQLSV